MSSDRPTYMSNETPRFAEPMVDAVFLELCAQILRHYRTQNVVCGFHTFEGDLMIEANYEKVIEAYHVFVDETDGPFCTLAEHLYVYIDRELYKALRLTDRLLYPGMVE